MAFTFSFPTVAAYRSAKNSEGTAEIYNALIPTSATGGTTNVARAAVSFIAELGRSVIDSVNVCVPLKEGGRPGDVLCYSPTYGYFWEKSPRGTWNADTIGQTYHDPTTWPSSFVRVGFCFYRKGHTALICSISDSGSTYAWSTDTSAAVAGVFTSSVIWQGLRVQSYAGIREIAEEYGGDKCYMNTWPLPRTLWDAACAAAKTGATASGSAERKASTDDGSAASYTASGGVATITVAARGGTLTVNPADWGYDFNLWYRENVEALVPGPSGAGGAASVTAERDANGVNNDGVRNTRLLHASASTTAAATYAIGYAVNAPDFGAGKWWLPTVAELIHLGRVKKLLSENGAVIASGAHWSSDQCNAAAAWGVYMNNGTVGASNKTSAGRVRPVSALYIE